jgi:hypothetical protein
MSVIGALTRETNEAVWRYMRSCGYLTWIENGKVIVQDPVVVFNGQDRFRIEQKEVRIHSMGDAIKFVAARL